jgi:hypothetical protein
MPIDRIGPDRECALREAIAGYEAACGEVEPVFIAGAFRLADLWEPPIRRQMARAKAALILGSAQAAPIPEPERRAA